MIWQAPNLAREPFANLRPLTRLVALLTIAAVALTGWNVLSYLRAGSGSAQRAAEIAEVERATAEARARLDTIERDLRAHDLAAENARATFLNLRIEERVFSWNQLFTRLAEVAPRGVRIRSLAPKFGAEKGRRGVAPGAGHRGVVSLGIAGEAQDDEALLEFVDRLFEHPAFDTPKLSKEAKAGGDLTFSLTVTYLPKVEP